MAALSVTATPTNTGAAAAPVAVAASDTIAQAILGTYGAYLIVNNAGGSTDNITISDAGATPAGNALSGGTVAGSVTTGTSKIFRIRQEQVNPSTGLVTITHSFTTSVTYELYPVSAS